ncbi:hypothetical protein ALC60_00115 [Trachymyrmex zeteki]|uniref:Uncharacterized protein n=1 Tax=Mycetomoellerius zeteki TaxID=64791 RepID=A0A151WET8_9HYME|nr:hypothetical protein ALC60_14738 [Trachymyrmex zeteki]KYQ53588.1 hypothetical protein ALC60_00115 [Trachymyrmex zeteki]
MLDSFWANSRRRHSLSAVNADLLAAYAGERGRSEARGNHFNPHTSLTLMIQPLSISNIFFIKKIAAHCHEKLLPIHIPDTYLYHAENLDLD